ncbi:hypothetical protein K443DRAFT_105148, partial [Laccaria amethystina LaAM-08-1]
FQRLREGSTFVVSWEIFPKIKVHAQKWKSTQELQKITDRLQKLQRLDLDYKNYTKLDIYYKFC